MRFGRIASRYRIFENAGLLAKNRHPLFRIPLQEGYMAQSARIIGERFLSRGRFDLTKTDIEVVEHDGAIRRLSHEVYRHGLAAAVLLYDPSRSVVMLVRQFRAGAYLCDGSLATIEACAGMLDGDAPEVCVVREAL